MCMADELRQYPNKVAQAIVECGAVDAYKRAIRD